MTVCASAGHVRFGSRAAIRPQSAQWPLRAKSGYFTAGELLPPLTSVVELTVGRVGFKRRKSRIEAVQCAAIRAQNPLLLAHLQKDVRMVLRRRFADTLECLRPDANLSQAVIILESRIGMAIVRRTHRPQRLYSRHGVSSRWPIPAIICRGVSSPPVAITENILGPEIPNV
jgi:hypothetical protein